MINILLLLVLTNHRQLYSHYREDKLRWVGPYVADMGWHNVSVVNKQNSGITIAHQFQGNTSTPFPLVLSYT